MRRKRNNKLRTIRLYQQQEHTLRRLSRQLPIHLQELLRWSYPGFQLQSYLRSQTKKASRNQSTPTLYTKLSTFKQQAIPRRRNYTTTYTARPYKIQPSRKRLKLSQLLLKQVNFEVQERTKVTTLSKYAHQQPLQAIRAKSSVRVPQRLRSSCRQYTGVTKDQEGDSLNRYLHLGIGACHTTSLQNDVFLLHFVARGRVGGTVLVLLGHFRVVPVEGLM